VTPRRAVIAIAMAAAMGVMTRAQATPPSAFVGSWNLTGQAPDTTYVYWLGVTESNGQLAGMFLNRGGHALPLAFVKVENGELVFRAGTAERPSGPEYRATLENGKLIGHHTLTQAGRRGGDPTQPAPPPTERVVNWIGVRRPSFPPSNANGAHTYGVPVMLFDGTSLDAFGGQNTGKPTNWTITGGLATNQAGADNLVSKQKFTDFKLHVEYRLDAKSNSGLYLRGRYELQLLDDATDTTTEPFLTHMAIYGRTAPLVKASKPAGEWQAMEATVVGDHVTVTLNGTRVHDNQAILGITGGALDADELAPGPLMVQGDHSGVTIRRIVVTPITTAGR